MNEEEKKAIEILEAVGIECEGLNLYKVIKNLIENQQKELNNLKEIEQQHKTDNGLLRQELDMQIEHNKELEEKLKITVAIITKGMYPEQNEGDNDFDKQFISKDKIKEKIEELEKEQKEYENSQEWEIKDDIVAQINVLEELLEEV